MPPMVEGKNARSKLLVYVRIAALVLLWLVLAFFSAVLGLQMLKMYIFVPWRAPSWTTMLPGLNAPGLPSVGMFAHWCGGFVVLMLGLIQPLQPIRRRWPAFHRACGNVYCASALVASVGGLAFIASSPVLCVGGWNMNVSFATYGCVFFTCAAFTWTHARARRIELHRNWAIRLWSQGIASLAYRIWYVLLDVAHLHPFPTSVDSFHRPLDQFLDWFVQSPLPFSASSTSRLLPFSREDLRVSWVWFPVSAVRALCRWFFVPNLLIAELVIYLLGPLPPPAAEQHDSERDEARRSDDFHDAMLHVGATRSDAAQATSTKGAESGGLYHL